MSIRVQCSMGNRYDGISTRSPGSIHSTLWKLSKELPKLLPSFAECFWSFAKLKEFHFKNLRVYMEAC